VRYTVDVLGERVEVDVREGADGLEVAVAGGAYRPARLSAAPAPLYTLSLGSERHALLLEDDPLEPGGLRVRVEGAFPVPARAEDPRAAAASRARSAQRGKGTPIQRSAMPGVIVEVRVAAGAEVQEGAVLVVLEAMKMQNEIRAERSGVVQAVHVSAGESVPAGAKLIEFAAEPATTE